MEVGGDYGDGIAKTPIVIDNVNLTSKQEWTFILGFWNHTSRVWRRGKASFSL